MTDEYRSGENLAALPTPCGPCRQCFTRPATELWVGAGGSLAVISGAYQYFCKRCVLEKQLAYAREIAAQVGALEAALAAEEAKA